MKKSFWKYAKMTVALNAGRQADPLEDLIPLWGSGASEASCSPDSFRFSVAPFILRRMCSKRALE
jgi:hypothetical protein